VRYDIFRWYRSSFGRFTQADPLGLIGGLNQFAYAKSNPLLYVDTYGREAARTCCKGVCVVQNLIEPAPEATAATECAGYRREYECLKRNRHQAPNPGMVDRRMDQIKEFLDHNYPTCFAGQTWR